MTASAEVGGASLELRGVGLTEADRRVAKVMTLEIREPDLRFARGKRLGSFGDLRAASRAKPMRPRAAHRALAAGRRHAQ
jgi:hypothetical protein